MKKHRFTLAATLLAIFLIAQFACSKYNDTSTPTNTTPPDETVTASLQGRVLDENGLPVKDAVVTSGAATTTTDVNGVFTFSNISMSSRFGFVKVVKQGYFMGARSILTNAGAQNYVSMHLLPRVSKGSFASVSGGNITVQAGNTVAFDGGMIVNAATNAAYTGNVNVFAAYLDPTDPDLPNHVPGDLRGVSAAGKEVALQTFGMMGVELEGDAGEKLQVAPGKKATLTLAIPAALQASAPDSIPLWYFSDSSGKWMEQGKAVRQGNNYVGQVGHFTYWNCDISTGVVNFKLRLKDQHGNPLAYTAIQFTSPTFGVRGGYTDSVGYAQGLLPSGQVLLFQVISECKTFLYGENVGPTLADQNMGTLTVDFTRATLSLTGTVMDCSNNPVANGYFNVLLEGLNYRSSVTNGSFTLSINRCTVAPAEAQLTVGDYGTALNGAVTTTTVTKGNLDVGQLSACGADDNQFLNFTIAGATYNLLAPPDAFSYYWASYRNQSFFTAQSSNVQNLRASFRLAPFSATGIYEMDSLLISAPVGTYVEQAPFNCNITSYGPVNGFIEGNFNGPLYTYVDLVTPVPITGNFRIKRTF